MTQSDHECENQRRSSIDYDPRPNVVNGLSPGYPPVEQNGRPPDDYRDPGPRPMDSVRMDRYPISPNQTMIKQERGVDSGVEQGGSKTAVDQEIRALNGIISAKEYEVTHFKDYNVHLQKVANEREYEIDKLKKKLRDVENERDGMEKKWLDQVQSHVKEKYLIADLQKEVLLWKGKFKNLLDRVQGLECDARRDFDYSCRRGSMADAANDFVHVTNVITSKVPEQRGAVVRLQDSVEKVSVIEGVGLQDGIVQVPVTGTVSVISRDRISGPRVYRPEPTYMYGYPSQAIHHSSITQNGIASMKMITSGVDYYDARRDVVVNGERSRDIVPISSADVSIHMNGEEEKEIEVDVDGKMEERSEDGDEDGVSKRLVIGNKAKIIVRKRNDPTRLFTKVANHHHKRKRVR